MKVVVEVKKRHRGPSRQGVFRACYNLPVRCATPKHSVKNLRILVVCVVVLGFIAAGIPAGAQTAAPCGVGSTGSALLSDTAQFGHGLLDAPRAALKPHNLKWELPFAAGAGILIAKGDTWAADRIQSLPLQNTAGRWSNIGLGMELGASALTWALGCGRHRPYMAESGFKSLEAVGLGLAVDLGLKASFNRQYPYSAKSTGEFWEGGKSFPSGHTVASFAFASAMAHRYPHNPWIKWGSYALATGVSLSRLPAKKHFPSDVLVGVPIGYLIGAYVVRHGDDHTP